MSFKSIELQIAIPRTQDAGKMQEQMMKQGQQFQETLTEQQLDEEHIKRKQVNGYDPVKQQTVDAKDKHHQQERDGYLKSKKNSQEDTIVRHHPYLGKNVDFTG